VHKALTESRTADVELHVRCRLSPQESRRNKRRRDDERIYERHELIEHVTSAR